MSRVFIEVFNLSIAASWLIAAVLIVRALITKRMPKWISCCLWALVAIRLLVPFSLESSFSLVPDQQIVIKESVSAQTPEESLPTPPSFEENISSPVETPDCSVQAPVADNTVSSPEVSVNTDEGNIAIPSVPEINGTVNEGVVNNGTVNGTVDALPNATQDKPESDLSLGKTTASVLGWVWVAGVCAMLSYALISALLLKRRVSLSVPCGENVRKGEAVESPFVFGILRPRIYIPYGLDKVTEECVLAHERAHIKRKDHLIKPFGFLLLSVYWFNPLVWVAYVLLCRDIEYACDEKVINDLAPEARKNYALALLDCAAAHKRIVACPVAFGETGVKERVKNTMKYKKPAFWIILIGIISCIVVGALFLTTSSDNDESQNNESSEITEDSEGTSSESELPESSYGKNDLEYIDDLISVERADEETIASLGVYDKYGEEQTNGFLYVFLPKEDVTEFAIHRIDYVDIAADVPVIRIEKTLYTQNELTTKKPLVAMIEMDDILPMNSISFKDKAGNTYYYGIAENNYDGGLWIQRQYLEGTEPSEPEEETEFYVIYANEKRSVPDKYRNLVADLMTSGGWSDLIPEIVPNFIIQIGETKYEYEASVGNINCDGKSKTLTSNEIKELNAVLTEIFSEYFEENGEDLPENNVQGEDKPANVLAPGNPIQKTHQTPEVLTESSESKDAIARLEKSPITPIYIVIRDADMSLYSDSDYNIIKKSGLKVWICTKDGKKVDYVYTNGDGVAAFETMEGEYTFYFEGTDKYAPKYYHKTVKVREVYTGGDWSYQYGSGYKRIRYPIFSYVEEKHTNLKIHVTDSETGEAISGAYVTVEAYGVDYEAYTDENGVAVTDSLFATYDGSNPNFREVTVTHDYYDRAIKDINVVDNEVYITMKKTVFHNIKITCVDAVSGTPIKGVTGEALNTDNENWCWDDRSHFIISESGEDGVILLVLTSDSIKRTVTDVLQLSYTDDEGQKFSCKFSFNTLTKDDEYAEFILKVEKTDSGYKIRSETI